MQKYRNVETKFRKLNCRIAKKKKKEPEYKNKIKKQ